MCRDTLINIADIIRNKYRFEIDGCIDRNEFFKAKFQNDKHTEQVIRTNLYKKIKK